MRVPSASLRPAGFDELGLRRALADRMLPLLVAAMAFLAALAAAGWLGTAALARHWRDGAGSAMTLQVPNPTAVAAKGSRTRLAAAVELLAATPGIASTHVLSDDELGDLLRPWLGRDVEHLALPMPAVVAVRLAPVAPAAEGLARQLEALVPGAVLEDHGLWLRRLSILAWSLQTSAGLALLLVAAVAAAVIAVATRAGLAARREAIEIVHGLGATDAYIAGRFAARATRLAAIGGLIGTTLAVPVLATLASVAAPWSGGPTFADGIDAVLAGLPAAIWLTLLALPAGASLIGFLTAQATVRRWLRQLP